MPTFGSLFAGIGGIDLGLERAGWTCRWQVEWDAYCQRVLAKHWPDVPRYGDITGVDWAGVERVDLLAGGFPCQPVSTSGEKRAQNDERWLWPEFARAIRALRPGYVLVENVTNLLAVNGGSAFGDVLGDLAALGYDAEWDCIPAAAVGALHDRDRVWIVAYPARWASETLGPSGVLGSADSGWTATRSVDGRLSDGRPWATEPTMGRLADGVPDRLARQLHTLGNAVVPQVVEVIGRQLLATTPVSDDTEPGVTPEGGEPRWTGPGERPHNYSPDYQAMGDCKVCGHIRDDHDVTTPVSDDTEGAG